MRALSYISVLLVSSLLWSCEGSFGTNNTGGSPQTVTDNSVWYHIKNPYAAVTINGDVHVIGAPAAAKIVVAWETGNNLPEASFIIFGTGQLIPNGGQQGNPGFNINFFDSLPRIAVTLDTAAKTAIAVGHLFLVNNDSIHDSTVIKISDIPAKYKLLGTGVARNFDQNSGLISIVYRVGNVVTPAFAINGNNAWINSYSVEGAYTFLASSDQGGGYPIGLFSSSHFDIDDRPRQGSQDYQLWLR